MNEEELLRMARDLHDRVEKEVWLRLLEKGFAADVRRHPEIPAPALTAAMDQFLASERVEGGLYDVLVQDIAGRTTARLDESDGPLLDGCGVCSVAGLDEHRRP